MNKSSNCHISNVLDKSNTQSHVISQEAISPYFSFLHNVMNYKYKDTKNIGFTCQISNKISLLCYIIRTFVFMDKFNGYNKQLDFSELENYFLQKGVLKTFRKKEYFARQNEQTKYIGLIKSGIFRLTCIDDNVNEWIIGYAFEGEFLSDYPALTSQINSSINIQASCDSSVYLLTSQEINDFWETSMDTQRLGRQIAEMMFAEIYQRLINFYCDTPEQRYIALMNRCPNLKERVSLKEIASFLRVTPETVSHIRKKLLKD